MLRGQVLAHVVIRKGQKGQIPVQSPRVGQANKEDVQQKISWRRVSKQANQELELMPSPWMHCAASAASGAENGLSKDRSRLEAHAPDLQADDLALGLAGEAASVGARLAATPRVGGGNTERG